MLTLMSWMVLKPNVGVSVQGECSALHGCAIGNMGGNHGMGSGIYYVTLASLQNIMGVGSILACRPVWTDMVDRCESSQCVMIAYQTNTYVLSTQRI
jgi:hypothetical protein